MCFICKGTKIVWVPGNKSVDNPDSLDIAVPCPICSELDENWNE